MRTKSNLLQASLWSGVLLTFCFVFPGNGDERATLPTPDGPPAKQGEAISWSQIGAKAGANYTGDGLAVTATTEGARLRCVFQKLDGEATSDGLWLTSTVPNQPTDRFRVKAVAVEREGRAGSPLPADGAHGVTRPTMLPATGEVSVANQTVRFIRPGLVEEYTVSMDGVRQDFVVLEKPGGASVPASRLASSLAPPTEGHLRVELAVTGARVEPIPSGVHPVRYAGQAVDHERGNTLSHGARLVLEESGRKIAYSRLRVTDATGKELAARMDVVSGILPDVEGVHPAARNVPADSFTASLSERTESAGLEAPALRQAGMPAATALAVVVDDAQAVYPIRIDPTFSDANWISMGGIPGADLTVDAAVLDESGNLYIGGYFTVVGDAVANYIAKWNGSSWSPLGSGMDGDVRALAVSGNDLYAGGYFTTAGGSNATYVARWNGSTWSALGMGMSYEAVSALAVSGSDLYAGGYFTRAGELSANHIAKWNGTSWNALSSGTGGAENPYVYELAASGSDLYAGGSFTTLGGVSANRIAKWNGSSWSALGSGMNGWVSALMVLESDLYAGGSFTTAGGVSANHIAIWNGSSWSALGSGMNTNVHALVVSGSDLYAGGWFSTAGGVEARGIAKWNGSSWSALGSGMAGGGPTAVDALAVSGSDLYAGGWFSTAGGVEARCIAKWNGSSWSALGSGLNGEVRALAVSGNDLYAVGGFTTASGVSANYIAKWNGGSWSALGSGMNNWVFALAVSGSDLYAGGAFTTAGGKVSAYLARAVLGDAPGYNQLTGTPLSEGAMQFSYIGYPATNYALDRTFNLSPPVSWGGQQTNTMTVSGVLMFTNAPVPGTNNFWRVRSVP